MSRGFYSATAAMMSEMERFETVANNLANVNTHGFKRKQTLHHDFAAGFVERTQAAQMRLGLDAQGRPQRERSAEAPARIGELGTGTYVMSTWTLHEGGALESTGNPYDLALQGEGFFVVQDADGKEHYTRNGHFGLNAEGELVTGSGMQVLGENGPLRFAPGTRISLDAQGRVFDGQTEIDSLRLVNFKQPQQLVSEGSTLFANPQNGETAPVTASLVQGSLEQSNVDVAGEMVQMISALRSYQIAQKALQSEDDMSGKLINQVGRA